MELLLELLFAELFALAVRFAWARVLSWINGASTSAVHFVLPSFA